MIPAALEKLLATAVVLVTIPQGTVSSNWVGVAVVYGLLGLLFLIAFVKTADSGEASRLETAQHAAGAGR